MAASIIVLTFANSPAGLLKYPCPLGFTTLAFGNLALVGGTPPSPSASSTAIAALTTPAFQF